MLRRSARWLCVDSTFKKSEAVWNIKFGDRATTHDLDMHRSNSTIPMFSVMDFEGNVVNAAHDPAIPEGECRKIMETMVRHNQTDRILVEAQRQGRISFYMTGFGEEAAVVGSAAGLKSQDYMYMQYREAAALAYRGYTIPQMIAQCMGNVEDPARGRQMPIHYGSPELNVQTISSPLATQIPQAAGAGYAFKLEEADKVCVCYFGDGSASEGDFHAGVNFATTTGAQTMFICRNNGYAISTPTKDQYRGDGIVPRGIAYGMPSVRVDGTDLLAVYRATKELRSVIVGEKQPAMLELMGYRVGHHSTSDDSTRYRGKDEIQYMDDTFNPIARFEKYLVKKGWWSAEETAQIRDETRKVVLSELVRQEKLPLHPPELLFEDTTKEPLPTLKEQRAATLAHYERNKEYYGKH
uniref:2-oxoisovalerate dehydrogenase subunit alpha n=1 Tax=Neobodo designis TaxID=312471 RepID=A0A7S1R160_NEODS